jgi:hypothetical protein
MTNAKKNPGSKHRNLNQLGAARRYINSSKKPTDGKGDEPLQESSRGDWTPLELFIAGLRGWEAGLRRQFNAT